MTEPLWEYLREGCGTCVFRGAQNQHNTAQCRRYPPVLIQTEYPDGFGGFRLQTEPDRPWVAQDDWCGEYKRRTSE